MYPLLDSSVDMGFQKMNDMLYQLKNSKIKIEMFLCWNSLWTRINTGESNICHNILEQMDCFASTNVKTLIRHKGTDLSLR